MRTDDALTVWVRQEQHILWHDLQDAIETAINGVWSMKASNIARRIVEAARLVGPTNDGSVPYGLTAGGVYAAVLTAGGIEFPELSEEQWQVHDGNMAKYGTTRETMRPRYAATVEAIRQPRETHWINGGDE